jgi:hypothetical protein
MSITRQQMITFARKNNINITISMEKAELEAAITPFLTQQLNNKQERQMQYILNTPSSMMSIKCAMDMHLPTDDMRTVITTNIQSSVEVHIIPTYTHVDEVVVVDIDMDEAARDAQSWYNIHTSEHALDEADKPSPSKSAIEVFINLISRKHQLYHTLDTMTIMDPKDITHPQYAVRDEKGEITQYNRNTAWAEALRQWDWNLNHHRARVMRVLGINMARDAQGKLTSFTRGITTYPPTYTFTTTKGRVIKVVEGMWIDDTKVVAKALATKHGLKQVNVTVTENKRNDKAYQDAFYQSMIKRIKTLKAMMGTKSWDADKRTMMSNQDGIEVDGHKAGYDYGKAARITRAMTEAQAPIREEIKGINVRLNKATDLFGYKIWFHYHDAMNVDLNLNFISGQVDETCDDLNAHCASLNRGDDLSKAHQEEIDGKMAICSWDDREEGNLGSGHRMPFRTWDDQYEKDLVAQYVTHLDTLVMDQDEEMAQFFMECEELELTEEQAVALLF